MDAEQIIEDLRDEVMATRFAFMTLARELSQAGLIPLPNLIEQLNGVAEQLAQPEQGGERSSLAGVSTQMLELSGALAQLL